MAIAQSPTAIQHASPLLRLPGEIKNRIFDLVHPNGITILLRVVKQRSTGTISYQFYPAPPPLAAVCQQFRADFPVAQYYSEHTSHISDSTCPTFVSGSLHTADFRNMADETSVPSTTVCFPADTCVGGIYLHQVVSEIGFMGTRVCHCVLHRLCEEASEIVAGKKAIAAVLNAYGRIAGGYQNSMRSPGVQGNGLEYCGRCHKIKGL